MNITLNGGVAAVGLTYRQALKVAYDEGKAKGTLDEETIAFCENELRGTDANDIARAIAVEATLREPTPEGVTYLRPWGLKEIYEQGLLNAQNAYAQSLVDKMQGVYDEFREELKAAYPELSKKVFGFTVSAGGDLQVTAPPNVLNKEEQALLNGLLNKAKDLKALTIEHSKAVIEWVKLDKEKFKPVIDLDLSNVHGMINYGLLLNKGASHLEMVGSWLDQMSNNAKREEQEKSGSIDTRA